MPPQTTRTKTPPIEPLELVCPNCDRPITYIESFIAGLKPQAEQ